MSISLLGPVVLAMFDILTECIKPLNLVPASPDLAPIATAVVVSVVADRVPDPTNTPLIYGEFNTKIIKPFGNYVFRPLSEKHSYLEVGMVIYADQTLGATIGGGEGWYGYNGQGPTGWFKFSGTQY